MRQLAGKCIHGLCFGLPGSHETHPTSGVLVSATRRNKSAVVFPASLSTRRRGRSIDFDPLCSGKPVPRVYIHMQQAWRNKTSVCSTPRASASCPLDIKSSTPIYTFVGALVRQIHPKQRKQALLTQHRHEERRAIGDLRSCRNNAPSSRGPGGRLSRIR